MLLHFEAPGGVIGRRSLSSLGVEKAGHFWRAMRTVLNILSPLITLGTASLLETVVGSLPEETLRQRRSEMFVEWELSSVLVAGNVVSKIDLSLATRTHSLVGR